MDTTTINLGKFTDNGLTVKLSPSKATTTEELLLELKNELILKNIPLSKWGGNHEFYHPDMLAMINSAHIQRAQQNKHRVAFTNESMKTYGEIYKNTLLLYDVTPLDFPTHQIMKIIELVKTGFFDYDLTKPLHAIGFLCEPAPDGIDKVYLLSASRFIFPHTNSDAFSMNIEIMQRKERCGSGVAILL